MPIQSCGYLVFLLLSEFFFSTYHSITSSFFTNFKEIKYVCNSVCEMELVGLMYVVDNVASII